MYERERLSERGFTKESPSVMQSVLASTHVILNPTEVHCKSSYLSLSHGLSANRLQEYNFFSEERECNDTCQVCANTCVCVRHL